MIIVDYLSLLKKKLRSKKESYSFGTIDILVNYFFKNKSNGFFVDVGCSNPISNNNTFLLYKNKNWSGINIDLDQKNIDPNEMSEILSSTTFIPCPNGFVHPETYRLYEALECECIPIVENTYQYYERLFPLKPFLKTNVESFKGSIIVGSERSFLIQFEAINPVNK